MKYLSLKEQLREERRKSAELQAKLSKKEADIDYIAMMCDVELENTDEQEGEPNEPEIL